MAFISTDHRDYLTPERPPGRQRRAHARAHLLTGLARVAAYLLVAFGIVFIGWGAGFDSAWILGVLFAYPLTETLGWIIERVRDRAASGRAAA